MSVNHNTIAFIGKTFESQDEAFSFLKESGFFKDKTSEELEIMELAIEEGDTSIGEVLMMNYPGSPSAEYLNYYTGEGFFIGYTLCCFDIIENNEKFLKEVEDAKDKWKKLFNESGEYHLMVQVS